MSAPARLLRLLEHHRSLRVALWLAAAAVVPLEMAHAHWAITDDGQLVPSLRALAHLDLAGAYGPGTGMTSPPLVLVALVWAVALGRLPDATYLGGVGALSLLWVAWAAARLARCLRPSLPSAAGPLLAIALALSDPVRNGLVGLFHPEDALATGLALLAVEAATRGRAVRTGLLLGAALLTRQWAILLVPALLCYPRVDRRRVAAVAAAACAAVLLPFVLADPHGVEGALRAQFTAVSPYSVWWHLPRSVRVHAFVIAREGPLLAAVPVTLLLRRRWAAGGATGAHLAAACGVLCWLRQPFDTYDAPYYLLPAFTLLVVSCAATEGQRRRMLALVAVAVDFALANQWRLDSDRSSVLGCGMVEVLLVCAAYLLWRSALPGQAPDGETLTVPGTVPEVLDLAGVPLAAHR